MKRISPWGILGCLLLCACALQVLAEPPSPPPYYAIQNVRVVTGNGQVLDNVTVTLADGLIEAIGADLAIPADAWVLDGSGMTLYPGLIDGMSALGQKKKEEEEGGSGARGGQQDAPPIRGPQDRPATTPWLNVAAEQGPDDKIERWRKVGFTTAMSAPADGIFAGQAAMIQLGDSEPDQRVLRSSVAQRLNFDSDGGFRSFPGSLMGGLAYIKQIFEDTAWYSRSKADYAKDPKGRARPIFDPALEPIESALADGTPFLLPANLAREIDRALTLAASYDLPPILFGAQAGYARTAALKSAGASVLLNLDWPKESKDRDPDAETDIRTLIYRRLAPGTPAALAAAGVPFAFTSQGMSGPSDIFEGVRKAIAEGGLSDEDALVAFSSGAARIFGVDDRVGTIEKGKIANLVLASDWPWAEEVEIAAVFVDGRRYFERKTDEPTEEPASDVSGKWALVMKSPRGDREMTLDLTMEEDGKAKGEIHSEMGDTKLDEARMSADMLRFKTTREFGGRSMTASWTLTVEGEKLSGTMSAGPMAMDISGERTEKPSEESAEAEEEESAVEVDPAELAAAMRSIQGPVREMGSFAISNVTIWTLAGDNIESGTVLVKDGKIAAVGSDVKIPGGVETIDGEGGHLIPGIIDCHSHMAISGGVNEGTLAVTSMVRIGDVVNPDDIAIYRALAGGVTAANLLHGSANPIGGQNQVIKLRWGSDAESMKLAGAAQGIKFALGENPKRSNFRSFDMPQRYPQTRMGVMDVIRDAFTRALEYKEDWAAYERGEKRNGVKVAMPRRDLELEALVEILDGERLVHSHCYRADEILQLMRLAEEFGFRIATLQHVLEGYKVADEMAAHGAGGSTFSDWWGYKVEAYDAIPHNAALMAERGVVVSINSDSSEEIRHLNQEAGKCVKWGGMDEIEALKMVTLNPARQLRIDDRVGSIEVGKDADLALYDGHPLEIRSIVQKTFVDGDLYFDLAADRERTAEIDALKEKLGGKKGDAQDATPASSIWSDSEHYSCREDH